ncbi:MAG: fumarylacetoacetate hydrolase [marine bacterium B5-7]|nr:MAG: fumarylacetoacetate hydrolase [marine bacterium B5-7]
MIDSPRVGWKIAATSIAGQRHIAVEYPLIGQIMSDRVYASPANLLLRDNRMRVAEAEFCLRFGRDLPAGDTTLTRETIMDYVDALFPAIEVPDSRFNDFIRAGAACLVADNACAREFVLGDEVTGEWRDIALDRFPVTVYANDQVATTGTGSDVLGDPRDALTFMVNECSRRGLALKAGEFVTTGVIGRPVTIEPNSRIVADFGVLGRVEANFASLP